jgi:hypothetical protein
MNLEAPPPMSGLHGWEAKAICGGKIREAVAYDAKYDLLVVRWDTLCDGDQFSTKDEVALRSEIPSARKRAVKRLKEYIMYMKSKPMKKPMPGNSGKGKKC